MNFEQNLTVDQVLMETVKSPDFKSLDSDPGFYKKNNFWSEPQKLQTFEQNHTDDQVLMEY
jgi:hypothetical protein